MTRSMQKALDVHAARAAAYLASADAVDAGRWSVPPGEGKWSPAEVTAHLLQTYDVVIEELRGGKGLAVRAKRWQQIVYKAIFGWRILYFGRFPRGIRAPREIRPESVLSKDDAIAEFRRKAEQFTVAAQTAPPGMMLSHTWFGRSQAAFGVRFCAQHIEHHRHQLAR